MTTIHIKASVDTPDNILSELMNILIKHGFETDKYIGMSSKIIMAKRPQLTGNLEEKK